MNQKQIVFTLAITMIGLVVGGLYGSRQDPGYETRHVVMLDQALRIEPFESGPRTAAFATAMLQASSRERAAEATGLDASDFQGIFASRVDSSPVMEVSAITSDRAGAADRVDALIEATLLELIDQERATEQLIVDGSATEVAELEAQLAGIYESTGVARGGNLAERLEQDQFALASATRQLEGLPEDETYWNVRLPGEIEGYEGRIAAITPVLDSWLDTTERLDELESTSGSSQRRLTELEAAETIVREQTAVLEGSTVARSSRIAAGRWAAVGGVVGLVAAVAFVGIGTLVVTGRSRVPRSAPGGSSAAAAS